MFSLIWSIIALLLRLGLLLLVLLQFWDDYKYRKFLQEEREKEENPPKGP